MQPPAIPENETQRMEALRATNILFTPSEERFDRITRLATRVLGTPIALVTLIADDLQWFKSAQGIVALETPRELSFCGHAILGENTFVVGDAHKDPRFADNPMVTGAPNIRAYAGHPLRTPGGSRIGTLCVIDVKPRKFTRRQLQGLRDLAAIAEAELERAEQPQTQADPKLESDEQKRKASIDGLTRLWNQGAVLHLLEGEVARAKRGAPTCVVLADIDDFAVLERTHDQQACAAALVEVSARVRRAVRGFDIVGYSGEGEFIVVLSNCSLEVAKMVCERIRSFAAYEPVATPGGLIGVTISIGLAICDAEMDSPTPVVAAADVALRRAKSKGGNTVEIEAAVGSSNVRTDFGATGEV